MNSLHEAQLHHEDSVAFQKRFTTDVNCLEKAVMSNPFMLEKVMVLNNHNKVKFNNSVFEDIKIIETEGEKQFLNQCYYHVKLIQFTGQLQQEVSLWPSDDSSYDGKICRRW